VFQDKNGNEIKLENCRVCGANPKQSAVCYKAWSASSMVVNYIKMECRNCGYMIVVDKTDDTDVIFKMWNLR